MSSVGRPSLFNKQVCDEICVRIAGGESLRSVCSDAHIPDISTVIRWTVDVTKKEFCAQYAQARLAQYYVIADELVDLSNPPAGTLDSLLLVNRNRLQIDTRKWVLSKRLPAEFGDKVEANDTVVAEVENLSVLTIEEQYQLALLKRKMKGN